MLDMLKHKKLLACLFIASLIMASGCATLEGAGEDIERAGEEIQEVADS